MGAGGGEAAHKTRIVNYIMYVINQKQFHRSHSSENPVLNPIFTYLKKFHFYLTKNHETTFKNIPAKDTHSFQ